jgi:pyruvate dehydrogenase E2 component (dihydrolipoamide acetyltransferase)
MATEIKLPPPGEGLETVTVLDVKVKPGDTVKAGQPLLEIEAEKSTVEVPAPGDGRIGKVLVKKGDQVEVGQTLFVLEDGQGAPAVETARAVGEPLEEAEPEETRSTREAPLVEAPTKKEGEKVAAAVGEAPAGPAGNGKRTAPPARPAPPPAAEAPAKAGRVPLAGPATRRLARELGVDLDLVAGSGRNGRITAEDVKSYVRRLASGAAPVAAGPGVAAPKLPDFARFGPVEREPLTQVRRLTAQQTAVAWSLVPHVTQHDLADVTELEAFRKAQKGDGPKLTVTAFALKASAIALKEFPPFNASLDQGAGQLVLKRYYHIGVAVDTERGLLVPVIRDVDKKSVAELARELAEVAERARQGKAEMQGGSFTITNLGGIGGTGFTPIVNYPEVAILGLSRSRLEPVVRDGQVVPRLLLPLSLSYDHRVIDGAAAARFTRRLAEMLENPLVMLLHA